ncbi:MAG: gamma-glutamyltransferase [Pseudomonadota bacterium]
MRKIIVFFLVLTSSTVYPDSNFYAIATAHELATKAGEDILQSGGNAFDAAVAISAALAVVEPYGSGIGGGGFWLLHNAQENTDVVIDGRETAPLNSTANMYLDDQGQLTRDSIDGPSAAGIPGVIAALQVITDDYGNLALGDNLQPAIRLAQNGFHPGLIYQRLAKFRQQTLLASPSAAEIFLNQGNVPESSDLVIQSELADTLSKIAAQGAKVFYEGEIAKKLVEGVQKAGGIWLLEDLEQYKIIKRQPIRTKYHNYTIIMPPPPTSGGVVIAQILAMLEEQNIFELDGIYQTHMIVEAMRRAYQDRAIYLGDPAFVDIPMQQLLDKEYAKQKFSDFNAEQASLSQELPTIKLDEGKDTTHFSVLDSDGNYVSATLSINYPFGSGFVPPGTGVLLNDEMDDFSMGAGIANVYGLVGTEANAIEPGKRMLSSMTPLFVRNEDKVLIVGTPGGSRIISMLALAILDFTQGMNSEEIVSDPRIHHQYLPDVIQFESEALSKEDQKILIEKGHELREIEGGYGDMQAIIWNKQTKTLEAASDPRGEGLAIVK